MIVFGTMIKKKKRLMIVCMKESQQKALSAFLLTSSQNENSMAFN